MHLRQGWLARKSPHAHSLTNSALRGIIIAYAKRRKRKAQEGIKKENNALPAGAGYVWKPTEFQLACLKAMEESGYETTGLTPRKIKKLGQEVRHALQECGLDHSKDNTITFFDPALHRFMRTLRAKHTILQAIRISAALLCLAGIAFNAWLIGLAGATMFIFSSYFSSNISSTLQSIRESVQVPVLQAFSKAESSLCKKRRGATSGGSPPQHTGSAPQEGL